MTSCMKTIAVIIFISFSARECYSFSNEIESQAVVDSTSKSRQKVSFKNEGITLSGGYLLVSDYTSSALNRSSSLDTKLAEILARNGPELRTMRDFKDFNDVSVDIAKRAWQLMHNHAETAIRERLNLMWPLVDEALTSAQVSSECHKAASLTVQAAKQLESWAVQMISAWGNFPPAGIYEGTFGDIGSYHGCLDVPENKVIGHAHYCSISYQPVLPIQAKYELFIRKVPAELRQLFASKGKRQSEEEDNFTDAFTDLLNNAQYNHYIYYKFGTCFPIQCTPIDVQKVAKLLGERSVLITGPVKCHSKYEQDYQSAVSPKSNSSIKLKISTRDLNNGVYIWKPHMTQTQVVALIIVSLILGLILFFTLIDFLFNILPKIYKNCHSQQKPSLAGDVETSDLESVTISIKHQHVARKCLTNMEQTKNQNGDQLEEEDEDEDVYDNNNNHNHLGANGDNNNKSERKLLSPSLLMAVGGEKHHKEISKLNMYELADVVLAVDLSLKARPSLSTQSALADSTPLSRESLLEKEKVELNVVQEEEEEERQEKQVGGKYAANGKETKRPRAKEKKRWSFSAYQAFFMNIVDDGSIVTNARQFFQVSSGAQRNDILCINGIRCITMSWIIVAHTMQYNDWAAFARSREIETHLRSLINQPLFNASYLVDSFFLISGLLTSFSSFKSIKKKQHPSGTTQNKQRIRAQRSTTETGLSEGFSVRSYLIGRYLRLTPQVMLISLLIILLPLLSGKAGSPHWYTITGEYSENCAQNWWINLFYIQAFYESNEMCNFVSWWISVDMFYHLFALALILLILRFGYRRASSGNATEKRRVASGSDNVALPPEQQLSATLGGGATAARASNSWYLVTPKNFTAPAACAAITLAHAIPQAIRHYQLEMPPNLLSTIPQAGAMWSEMTLKLFWTPYAHAFPFFFGFYLGHLMAEHSLELERWFTLKRATAGWCATGLLLITQSYSTYFWVIGHWNYSRLVSTLFFLVCPLIWSTCLGWIILSCHYKYGGFVNRLLSCKLFIILGKASFIVYLSHFLVLFTFFGSQNLLLEPTRLLMVYVMIGNICLSMLLGSLLCIVFEMPWLKMQRRLMKFIN